MATEYVRGTEYRVATLSDVSSLRRKVEADLLPRASSLRIIGKAETIEALSGKLFELPGVIDELGSLDTPNVHVKEWALFNLERLAMGLLILPKLFANSPEGSGFTDQIFGGCERVAENLDGYLAAMQRMIQSNQQKAVAGRQRIGDATRRKVVAAAAGLRGNMSREVAAPLIAELVGKAPSTVRRLLSDLFPGNEWAPNAIDGSDDLSR